MTRAQYLLIIIVDFDQSSYNITEASQLINLKFPVIIFLTTPMNIIYYKVELNAQTNLPQFI